MHNLIKIIPLMLTSLASMSATNRDCAISFVNIEETPDGLFINVGIETYVVSSIKFFYVEIYANTMSGRKNIGAVGCPYSTTHLYTFHNDVPYSYDLLDENTSFVVLCRPDYFYSESETVTCPYVGSKFALKNIAMSEKDNNKIITPKYLSTNYNIKNNPKYTTYNDQLTFKNYEDNIICPVYKNFDMSILRFHYKNGLDDVLKGEFSLNILDTYSLFPCFPLIDDTMYRKIPLAVKKDQDDYYFVFKDILYYEPSTFKMALEPKDGYYPTSSLFMPKGYYQKLNTLKCRLTMNIDSFYAYNVTGEFHIRYLKNYFGDCNDSEYCINMVEDYSENYREKIIEVIL